MPAPDHDVLISGGGPAGSALALALADGRRRIAVVEPRAGDAAGDPRATALSEGSVRLLDALGAWGELAADAVPIRRVEVSQQGHFGRTRIDAVEEGVAALGQVVPLGSLADVLAARARAAPGVEWIAPARVVDAASAVDGASVELAAETGGGRRTASLLVAADGTGSPLREALGIATRVHDYGQTALLGRVEADGDPFTAHERFTADGPLALLPGGDRARTLVWTVASERAPELAALPATAFAEAAAARIGRGPGRIEAAGAPATYPLRMTVATRTTGPRAALVGNAARTLHPVAAQGFNLALRDVCALAAALRPADDPGDPGVLAEWSRGRRGDQWRTQGFTDLLARAFHGGGLPAGAVRAGALIGLDLCPAARSALAAQTMGLVGGLPRVGSWRVGEPG